ncbi:strawberry notch [Micractinium conductrix]|uniref:Strawberry notch n=1 Tax=Micractinium conductrix TaxID=554055 RepID=A0A2P6V9I0_9CHLO|nr:strawberry notch [Micractinium conductrix]|eukprot:PSC70731.1 strawberry notch [Micractinium conductrix]
MATTAQRQAAVTAYADALIGAGHTGLFLLAQVTNYAAQLSLTPAYIPADTMGRIRRRLPGADAAPQLAPQLATAGASHGAAAVPRLTMPSAHGTGAGGSNFEAQRIMLAVQQRALAAQQAGIQPSELVRLQSLGNSNGSSSTAVAALPKHKHKRKGASADVPAAAAAAGGVPAASAAAAEQEEEEDDAQAGGSDEAEDGHTYAEYKSLQVRAMHPEIMGHPDPLVETASLASVPLPEAIFQHSLDDCVEGRLLSDAQLETVIYANQKFQLRLQDGKRAGFFLGDGAGVGKGRQIAALIKQHFNDGGRRALWVSVSSDLRHDAERDLQDVRAGDINICPRGSESVPTGKGLDKFGDGCLFITYSLLISGLRGRGAAVRDAEAAAAAGGARLEEGRLHVPTSSRLAQIVAWLDGSDEPPLIVLDECHKAKNLLPSSGAAPTQTARAVVELQEQLPEAKVLYSSATGASEPKQLAYMTRLGLFGFRDAKDMIELLSKSRLGALELAAMSLKATGCYLSRTLSYAGAEFVLAHAEVDDELKVMYDRASMMWTLMWRCVQAHPKMRKLQGTFWSAHQRFFKQMLIAAKVPHCAQMAKDAVQGGMAVVIGLQSTGEANTELLKETNGGEFEDLVSAPRMVLEQYVRSQFPLTREGASQQEMDNLEFQVLQAIEAWRQMRPAHEVVAEKAQGLEVERAAELMGLKIDKQQHQAENEVIAMRLKMKQAARDDEERLAAQRRRERLDAWQRRRAAQERHLREALEDATIEKQTAQAAVERLQGTPAQPQRQQQQRGKLEDSNSDEDEAAPLSRRAAALGAPGGGGVGGKRKAAAVLEDSDSDSECAGGAEAAPKSVRIAGQPAAARRRMAVVVDSDSDDDADLVPLAAMPKLAPRPPLAPRSNNENAAANATPAARPPLKFKKMAEPLIIDLTLEDDVCCMVCSGVEDAENMMLCDGCDRGCHAGCARLAALPATTTWHCSGCAAGKAHAGQQHAAAAAAVDLTLDDSDSDEDAPLGAVLTAAAGTPPRGGKGVAVLAAERRLERARRELRSAKLKLEAFREQTAGGPAATPPRLLRSRQARAGGPGFDPTVRNVQLGTARPEGYRNAVKAHDLTGLPQAPPAQPAAAGDSGGKGRRGGLFDEEESDEDELAEMDDDFRVPDAQMNQDVSPQLLRIRGWLLRLIQAMELPPNPLDHLIELLGGEEHVAELTGRKGFVCREGDERAVYKQRGGDGPQKDVNMREKEAFMQGRKYIAIISDAASTGISLQADRRVPNQRRRCHITLELPWSADKAVQQFGRSHRANQVSAPLYRILTVPVGGEARFASAAAKRLASLGALLRGDRNAIGAGSELKGFDIDNWVGEKALERVLRDICGDHGSQPMPGVKVPELPRELMQPELMHATGRDQLNARYHNQETPPFFQYMRVKLASVGVLDESESRFAGDEARITVPTQRARLKVPRFLNRLLGLHIVDQSLLFQYFQDTLDATIAQLRSEGKYEAGIVTVKGRSCTLVGKRVIYRDEGSGGEVHHAELTLDKGVTWEAAVAFKNEVEERLEELQAGRHHLSGFYVRRGYDKTVNGRARSEILLATEIIKSASNIRNTRFHIQRPNTGSTEPKTQFDLEQGYKRIKEEQAEELWNFWFQHCEYHCAHGDNCTVTRHGGVCEWGTRKQHMHLICGAVLPVWQRIEAMHNQSQWGKRRSSDNQKWPLRVVKTIMEDGTPLVGVEATCRDEMEYFKQGLNAAGPGVGLSAEEEAEGLGGGLAPFGGVDPFMEGVPDADLYGGTGAAYRGGGGGGRGKRRKHFRTRHMHNGEDDDEGRYESYGAEELRAQNPGLQAHPDPLVESSSLAAVPLAPLTFQHSIDGVVRAGKISDAQLQTVMYASQHFHGERLAGGAASRILPGWAGGLALVRQHAQEGGRRALWLSVSTDLRKDAERDLLDVGSTMPLFPKGAQQPSATTTVASSGLWFCTYSALIAGLKEPEDSTGSKKRGRKPAGQKEEPSLRIMPKAGSSLKQASLSAAAGTGQGRAAKNAMGTAGGKPSKTARAVIELQARGRRMGEQLPEAKVLYSSATGASEPANLAYMTRLGLWTPETANEFISVLKKPRTGALELTAMSLKATGSYLSRTLSYQGSEFQLCQVPLDLRFRAAYNEATTFWALLWRVCGNLMSPRQTGLFWGAHQRFYRQLLMAGKVDELMLIALSALDQGQCVVIGLQSTGEAVTEQFKELNEGGEFDELASAPRMILESFLRKHFPLDHGRVGGVQPETVVYGVCDALELWFAGMEGREGGSDDGRAALRLRTNQALDKPGLAAGEAKLEMLEGLARRLALRKLELEQAAATAAVAAAQAALEAAQDEAAAAAGNAASDGENEPPAQPARLFSIFRVPCSKEQAVAGGSGGPVPAAAHAAPRPAPAAAPAAPAPERAAPGHDVIVPDSESDWEDLRPVQPRAPTGPAAAAPPAPRAVAAAAAQKDDIIVPDSEDDDFVFKPGPARLRTAPPPPARNGGTAAGGAKKRRRDVVGNGSDSDDFVRLPRGSGKQPAPKPNPQAAKPAAKPPTGPGAEVKRLKGELADAEHALAHATKRLQDAQQQAARQAAGVAEAAGGGGASGRGSRASGRRSRAEVTYVYSSDSDGENAGGAGKGKGAASLGRNSSLPSNPLARRGSCASIGSPSAAAAAAVAAAAEAAAEDGAGGALKRRRSAGALELDDDFEHEGLRMESDYNSGSEVDPDLHIKGVEDMSDVEAEEEGAGRKEYDAEKLRLLLGRTRDLLLFVAGTLDLPANPLDAIIERLGGSKAVAELTGRKSAVVRNESGKGASMQQRVDTNLQEKEAFMAGRKLVAILSDAASTGISVQADRRVPNQRRRCHITLELPWSADKAIQQFGRSHRSNQSSAPTYKLLVTPLAGEFRFASAAAKRLQSLGALLHGDRHATGSGAGLKDFDVDNKYGAEALDLVLTAILGRPFGPQRQRSKLGVQVAPPAVDAALIADAELLPGLCEEAAAAGTDPKLRFHQYMRARLVGAGLLKADHVGQPQAPDKKVEVKSFLNKLLGMRLQDQKAMFSFFSSALDKVLAAYKALGQLDAGISTIRGSSCEVEAKMQLDVDLPGGGGEVYRVDMSLDRGLPFEGAQAARDEAVERTVRAEGPGYRGRTGFWLHSSEVTAGGRRCMRYVLLAAEVGKTFSGDPRFAITRPATGAGGTMSLQELQEKGYCQVPDERAKLVWDFWYDHAADHCNHDDTCATIVCRTGRRHHSVHIMSGAVPPLLQQLEKLRVHSHWGRISSQSDSTRPLRIVRAVTSTGETVIGIEASDEAEMEHWVRHTDREQIAAEQERNEEIARERAAARQKAIDEPVDVSTEALAQALALVAEGGVEAAQAKLRTMLQQQVKAEPAASVKLEPGREESRSTDPGSSA